MIKTSRVVVGETPSVVSGDASQQIVEGDPLAEGEDPLDPELKKAASLMSHDE